MPECFTHHIFTTALAKASLGNKEPDALQREGKREYVSLK